jgi:hypothetical protein
MPVPAEAQSPPHVTVELAVNVTEVPCTKRAEQVPLLQLIPVLGLEVTVPVPCTSTLKEGA